MADIYDTNSANTQQNQNWVQRNSDWLTPIATTAAQLGYNIYANKQAQNYNAQQAEIQRQYETKMANTAYQRQQADLAAAGLNPHLAGGQGGADTTAGATASSSGMNPMDLSGLNAYSLQTALTKSQMDNLEADTAVKNKQSGKTEAETKMINLQKGVLEISSQLEQALMRTNDKKMKQEIKVAQEELTKIKEETDLRKAEKEYKAWEARHPILAKTLPGVTGLVGGIAGAAIGGPAGAAIGSAIGNIGKRPIGFNR